jgi:hypothetical protein
MACAVCSSLNEAEFAGELTLHFPSSTLVTKPSVLTYPMISVCLDCGGARFSTSHANLRELREGIAPAA